MQDQIFNFLILIIFSEQHDHTATEQHRGTQVAEGTRGDGRRLASFPAFQGFRNVGTFPSSVGWTELRAVWLQAPRVPIAHNTVGAVLLAWEMGREEVQGGEEKGQAGALPL